MYMGVSDPMCKNLSGLPSEPLRRAGTVGNMHSEKPRPSVLSEQSSGLLIITHHTSHDFISPGLVSSRLSGCEATQFAVVATNQNAVGRAARPILTEWRPVFAMFHSVVTGFTVGFYRGLHFDWSQPRRTGWLHSHLVEMK